MGKYLLKRMISSVLTLLVILTVVFVLLRQMPIEGYFDNFDKLDDSMIAARLTQLGLDQPLHKQLLSFFGGLLHGDLGTSSRYSVGAPISGIIAQKAPISIILGLLSMGVALVLGIPLGAAMARSQSGFWDRFGTAFIVFVNAVPAAVYYIYLQSLGSTALRVSMLFSREDLRTWILPVFSMSLGNIAYYAMWLRRYMVDENNKDYVKLARAKGVNESKITMRHVFRNAFVPMIQYIPTSLMYTVCGSIYIESLYSIPGMGGLLVDVISRQDNPMVQAIVMIYSCIGIVGAKQERRGAGQDAQRAGRIGDGMIAVHIQIPCLYKQRVAVVGAIRRGAVQLDGKIGSRGIGRLRIVLRQLQLGGKVVFHIAALAVDLYIAIGIAVFQHGKLLARFQGGEYIAHRAPAFVFIWGDDQLRTRLHASLHRGQGGSDVAHLNLRDRVIDNQVGWVLSRQSRLDKGEQQQRQQHAEKRQRHPVFKEGAEGAAPIGIIGIADHFPVARMILRKRKGSLGRRLHALAQRIAHARLHRRAFPFAEHAHQRASPFPCREIRGSTSTISRSPRIRPTIPMQL